MPICATMGKWEDSRGVRADEEKLRADRPRQRSLSRMTARIGARPARLVCTTAPLGSAAGDAGRVGCCLFCPRRLAPPRPYLHLTLRFHKSTPTSFCLGVLENLPVASLRGSQQTSTRPQYESPCALLYKDSDRILYRCSIQH